MMTIRFLKKGIIDSTGVLEFVSFMEETFGIKLKDDDLIPDNCLLNSFANRVHLERYGFHPYVFEIAGMIRAGIMSREKGLKKILEPGSRETILLAKKKLGITEQDTEEI
ncbi:MAG: hypothetical protein ABIH89_02665 [Elusimicrobiota bacterium]